MRGINQRESLEERFIIKALHSVGAKVYKLSVPKKTKQTPGLPDLFAFVPVGDRVVPLWIEAKRELDADVRPEQRLFQLMAKLCVGLEHVLGGAAELDDWLMRQGLAVELPSGGHTFVRKGPSLDMQLLQQYGQLFEDVKPHLWVGTGTAPGLVLSSR